MLGRARVHGIYDQSANSLTVAAEEFARHAAYSPIHHTDLESACNDPDADALFICTPNYTHFDVLKVAAQSGKPILLEKPMATTLADAAGIVEIASQYPSFIQAGLQYRYKAMYVEARHEALQRQSLGDVKTISMSEYRPPFLDKVGQWNKFAAMTGGTLVEKCCHYFDLINLFAGSHPQRVYASGGQAVNFRDFEHNGKRSDIDDHASVVIDYANGISACFTLNMLCPHFFEELVISGERGRLTASETFNFHQHDVAQSQIAIELGENGALREVNIAYPRLIEQSGHHGSTFFEHLAFADRLNGKEVDSATLLDGLWSIIVASAAQESMRMGHPIIVDDFVDENNLTGVLQR